MSPAFRPTQLAAWFTDMFTERNEYADVPSINRQFKALQRQEPEGRHSNIKVPTIILTGSEDGAHPRSFALQERIPNCELRTLHGTGHACQLEQPWLFDKWMIEFLQKHSLFPA